ncbi:MAG: Omp28-related outer membrane protein [Bacteroidales bacterium]|nr:Omp28-related outer membrane protein [Bacteroidales bacterium]
MRTKLSIITLCLIGMAAYGQGLSVRSIDLDEYAAVGTRITITGTVANSGSAAIEGCDLLYIANGDTSAVMHLDRSISANGFVGFTHNVPYMPSAAGTLSVTVVAFNPGGDASAQAASLTVSIPVYDMSKAVTRNVLLEQFTTMSCGYCPGGHDRIHQALNGRNDVVWVCHHSGFNTDSLTIDVSTAILTLYGGNTWAPAMTLDRTRIDESQPGCVMNVASSVNTIKQQINKAVNVPCFVEIEIGNVSLSSSDSAQVLRATVSGRFSATLDIARPRVNLFLIEDSIIGRQSGASGSYRHDYVIRHCASSNWGDGNVIHSTEEGSTFSKNYTIPLQPKYRLRNCRLVAFVSNYSINDINDRRVYNATQSRSIPQMLLGIGDVPDNQEVAVFPNPASHQLFVDSDSEIEELALCDISGRVVLSVKHAAGNTHTLNVSSLPSGLYMLRIRSASGTSVQKVVIAR